MMLRAYGARSRAVCSAGGCGKGSAQKGHRGILRAVRARSDCYKETIIKVALIKRVVAQRRAAH